MTSMSTDVPQLNCLVYATQDRYHQLVSTWLGFSRRVGSVTSVESDSAAAKYLASANSDLAIIVVPDNSQSLPSCLQQYSELPVLVLTEHKEPRELSQWFQQGATDVVSIQNSAAVQHAISRLIDEHTLKQKLVLLDHQVQDLLLQNQYLKQILEKDLRFPNIRPTVRDKIQTPAPKINTETTVEKITIKGRYNFKHLDHVENPRAAQRISSAKPAELVAAERLADQTHKPNTRKKMLDRFHRFLQSNNKSKRYTALLVRVLNQPASSAIGDTTSHSDTSSLQSALRALKLRLNQATVMGQLNDDALLIVQDTDKENTSRDTANQVRALLGSLDGITDAKKEVRINTLTLRNNSKFSAAEAIERLESL